MNRATTPMVSLALLLGGVAAPAAAQPGPGLTDMRESPHVAVRSVGLADARWTTGFWADRFETCRAATLPAMSRIMEGTQFSHFLHNFSIAAGLAEGKHRGPPWNDGDCYKWIEATASVYALTKEPALGKQMDQAIAIIARAQRADGYLHTPVLIATRLGLAKAAPFQDRLDFELYNFGHLFTAACVHQRATGKETCPDVAVKAAEIV